MSSLNTLQELTRDAARYRWLRERSVCVYMPYETWIALTEESLDESIDEALESDE